MPDAHLDLVYLDLRNDEEPIAPKFVTLGRHDAPSISPMCFPECPPERSIDSIRSTPDASMTNRNDNRNRRHDYGAIAGIVGLP